MNDASRISINVEPALFVAGMSGIYRHLSSSRTLIEIRHFENMRRLLFLVYDCSLTLRLCGGSL